ncbi:hypothetical protein JRC04_26785 [Mycolicibacterium sp. S2-37]|uniref:hypothetical protein n=1 Tax=Mycolicibacterium sp. S2-37 TaxID=2810297 RepID=UPI001A93CF88|nr:hypothetical protein [Mycolicibacterium sp. S2-37]MBO0681088.1 hypothetical protein [Mycolicibacterium sp. S2-37]
MRRSVAVVWHASFSVIAAALYFFFVLPRWWELMGQTSHTLGTVLRIVTAALIGLAALPVVFTLLRTRRPEFGTPLLALRLRTTSIALHVLAAALILGAAISEIWLDLDSAGTWLFGIYGAAAATALLGMFAFYLAFVAELPPPPPKPVKPLKSTSRTRRRGRGKAAADEETVADGETDAEATESDTEPGETDPEEAAEPEVTAQEVTAEEDTEQSADESADSPATGGLRNRRPAGKDSTRRRRRTRGSVAVED